MVEQTAVNRWVPSSNLGEGANKARSSIGQDTSLSRMKAGFDSPSGYKHSVPLYVSPVRRVLYGYQTKTHPDVDELTG